MRSIICAARLGYYCALSDFDLRRRLHEHVGSSALVVGKVPVTLVFRWALPGLLGGCPRHMRPHMSRLARSPFPRQESDAFLRRLLPSILHFLGQLARPGPRLLRTESTTMAAFRVSPMQAITPTALGGGQCRPAPSPTLCGLRRLAWRFVPTSCTYSIHGRIALAADDDDDMLFNQTSDTPDTPRFESFQMRRQRRNAGDALGKDTASTFARPPS